MKIFIFLISLLLSGCATTYTYDFGPKNLDAASAGHIVKGKTTKTEVMNTFGQPQSRTTSSLGEMWMYTRSLSKRKIDFVKGDSIAARGYSLMVTFDENGIVKESIFSESNPLMSGTITVK